MTQNERVLRHLREVGTLTGAQAMQSYGIAHLASRISELRAAGKNIIGKTETSKNRYGKPCGTWFTDWRNEDAECSCDHGTPCG